MIRDLPVRVLADDGYRADMFRWRARIEAQLERVNRVLEAQLGVRFVAATIEPWARSRRAGKLADALAELVQAVPGGAGEWVIGFVSSSEVFSGSLEQLGMALPFGRHLVVRGMVSFQESEAFRRTLDTLSDAERGPSWMKDHREDRTRGGTWKYIGGTGKMAGIQGSGEHTRYVVRRAAEGTSQSVVKSTGTYKLPTTTAER